MWTLSNICYYVKDPRKLALLAEYDLMHVVIDLMNRDFNSGSMMVLCLHIVNDLLEKSEECRITFEKLDGHKAVEDLQISQYTEVYKQSALILEKFFAGQEMEELEKMEFINSKQDFII
jgi:hypothetical protein